MTGIDTKMHNVTFDDSASANWTWEGRNYWEEAAPQWQRFARKWRNVEEEDLRPQSRALDLGPDVRNTIGVNRLYIRKCYEEGLELVWQRAMVIPRAGAAGVIFTGQPGTGKTVFLWYLLIRLLQAKEVVLFHVHGTGFLLFYHDKVYFVPAAVTSVSLPDPPANSTSGPFIWSLFDLRWKEQPAHFLTVPQCFPVQTSSPDQSRYSGWQKARNPVLTGFPPWTPEELAICASHNSGLLQFKERLKAVVKHWPAVPEPQRSAYPGLFHFLKATHGQDALGSAEQAFNILLDALIAHFGPIPREVFSAMYNFTSQEERHKSALLILLFGFEELTKAVWELVARKQFPDTSNTDYILALYTSGVGVATTWQIEFKSDHIARQVSDRLRTKSDVKVRELIAHFSSVPEAKALAGQLFEPFVHRLIAEAGADAHRIWPFRHNAGNWSLQRMNLEIRGDPNSPFFALPDSPVEASGFPNVPRTQDVFDSVNIPHDLSNDMYYVADMSNLPFFDSFVVNLDFSAGSANLWIIQMSTSTDHRCSARGYVVVHKIMQKVKELLKNVPPPVKKAKTSGGELSNVKVSVAVHYVLVRPDGKGRTTWTLPKGWDEAFTENDHRGDGYVLDVPLTPDLSKLLSAGERH